MATLLSNCTDGLKRSASDAPGVSFKKIKFFPDIDSDASLSGESESVYSVQEHETATAYDTADTEDHEYEIKSSSEVTLSELSSGPEPENCVILGALADFNTINGSEVSCVGDLSDSFSSDNEEFWNRSFKQCEKCKSVCEGCLPLCLTCFRRRKTFRPPRPKGRRRKTPRTLKTPLSVLGSHGSSQEILEDSPAVDGEMLRCRVGGDASSSSKASGSSEDQRSQLCKCCYHSPVDGAFIHKNSVHSLYCYKCSLKQWKIRGRCPFCNQKLCKVAKIFPVE